MNLVREILDKRLIDHEGRRLGKVDGIIGEWIQGQPLRLVSLAVGPAVRLRRIHPALGDLAVSLLKRCGLPKETVIKWTDIAKINGEVGISESNAERLPFTLNTWFRKKVLKRK